MDPYLEEPALWPDVHLTLIIAMRAEPNAHLPERYVAAADRYVWIHEPEAEKRRLVRPDAYDSEVQSTAPAVLAPSAAPMAVILPAIRREGNKYLKIVDADSRRVITVIELLSPSNKHAGPDREAYLTKRIDYLTAGVNVVEIDLHRGGEKLPLESAPAPVSDYYVMTCRAQEFPKAGMWSFSVRDPLPKIPIPLSAGMPDVELVLQSCLNRAYAEGRYDREIDYQEVPDPPLHGNDAAWARDLIASQKSTNAD
jgi:Protein of unknown function (DUF4058)